MSALFSIDAKLSDLDLHGAAIPILFQIMNNQSQPIHVKSATPSEIVMGLRVNLNQQQSERLIVKPLREYLQGYIIEADYPKRELRLEREAVVSKKPKRKSAQASEPAPGNGVPPVPKSNPVVEPAL